MKVLMINSVCGIKSTGRICTDIAEELEKNGHECKIAYGRESVPAQYQRYAVRIGSDIGVKIHAGLSRIFDDTGFHSKRATKKFVQWIEEYNPDVIHLHNLHGYYIHLGILFNYLKKCGKRIIWTLHDCWAFTGHCAHFDFIGCKKWEEGCLACQQKKSYPSSLFFDKSKRNYVLKKELFTNVPNLKIVTPSKWLAGLVKKSFLREYPIEVIYNGIALNVFKPTTSDFREKYGLADKKVLLGVANAWGERKGFDDFLKLSEILSDDYRIVIVGLTEAQKALLPSKVIGILRTNSAQELAEIYTAADLFVNLTYEEVLGLVNIESLACGTPVVTYRTGGSPECIDETCGAVVEKNNLFELDEVIKTLLQTKPFNQTACLLHAGKFGWADKLAKYLQLYKV